MNANCKNYKIVYLSYFAINIILVISVLSIQWMNMHIFKAKEWLESWICFWGIAMVLSLWSKSFRVTSEYKRKKTLDAYTTRLFAFSLVIIEASTIYCSIFRQRCLLLVIAICMSVWLVVFVLSFLTGDKFLKKNNCSPTDVIDKRQAY